MPSRKPRVVLDTDVASKLWRSKLDQSSQQKLVGVTPVLTYITLAEWWQWGAPTWFGTSQDQRDANVRQQLRAAPL
jgi:hypothetical protein